MNLTVLYPDDPPRLVHRYDWLFLLTPSTVSDVSLPWINPSMVNRTVVVDYADRRLCTYRKGWYDIPPYKAVAYFKRSTVYRNKGLYMGTPECPSNTFPIHYACFDQWLPPETTAWERRPYAIVSTLRAKPDPISPYSAGGFNVVKWLREFEAETNACAGGWRWPGPRKMRVGVVSQRSDECFDQDYLRLLHSARIVVTCQPAGWEGDYRTWEAFSSGALVFMDRMHTPLPAKPRHGVHVVYYDALNRTDLLAKLVYYLERPGEARATAQRGQEWALMHHRAVNRIDYMLRTAAATRARNLTLGPLRRPGPSLVMRQEPAPQY